MKLLGKKAIVTGASKSIGKAIALAFAEEGADVVISYRSDEEGGIETTKTIQDKGRKSKAFHADFIETLAIENFCFTILIIFYCFSCHSQIIQVNDMKEISDYFNTANSRTLAIFDVDMVLVQPSDPAFQMVNMKRFGAISKRIMKGYISRKTDDVFEPHDN